MKRFFYYILMIIVLPILFSCSTKSADATDNTDSENTGNTENPDDQDDKDEEEPPSTKVPDAKDGTIYGTWVNVWVASSESWWNPDEYHGLTTVYPDGTWKGINWLDKEYRKITYDNLINAGIDFIITDNTNGTTGNTDALVKDFVDDPSINLKFCVAFDHTRLSNDGNMYWLSQLIKNPNYLKINGKPVLVCYVAKSMWDNTYNNEVAASKYQRYYKVWASGEITAPDKWGWQLEPEDGLVDSELTTYVTVSVKQAPGSDENGRSWWSKSFAMLDYTFAQTRTIAPKYVIAGSYDDCTERNGWSPLRTQGATGFTPVTEGQMLDPWTGTIAEPYVFYNRMKSWVKGEELYHIEGGVLSDGVYRLKNISGDYIQANKDYKSPNLLYGESSDKTYDKFVIYHLGDNQYRIVNVYTGMPLKLADGKILTDVWTDAEEGKFSLEKNDENAEWIFEPIYTFLKDEVDFKCQITMSNGTMTLDNFNKM